jgi:uracil-DNA glycosylase
MTDPLEGVHPSWRNPLQAVAENITAMGQFLRQEIADGRSYLPAGGNILRAFQTDFDSVRVLILGQDPYPTPGHAIGLSFAVSRETSPLPRSLQNIYREL